MRIKSDSMLCYKKLIQAFSTTLYHSRYSDTHDIYDTYKMPEKEKGF